MHNRRISLFVVPMLLAAVLMLMSCAAKQKAITDVRSHTVDSVAVSQHDLQVVRLDSVHRDTVVQTTAQRDTSSSWHQENDVVTITEDIDEHTDSTGTTHRHTHRTTTLNLNHNSLTQQSSRQRQDRNEGRVGQRSLLTQHDSTATATMLNRTDTASVAVSEQKSTGSTKAIPRPRQTFLQQLVRVIIFLILIFLVAAFIFKGIPYVKKIIEKLKK